MSNLASIRPPRTATARGTRAVAALTALTICAATTLYLVGNGSISLWDRDEPRYAQCSRQMLQSGDWVVPWYLDKWRVEKPPLIYWCQATAMRVFGDGPFAARLPSAVGILLVTALIAVAGRRFVGPRRAAWAAFIFASSALTIMSAKMCLTDAVLLLWITTAQICLYAIYRGNRSWGVTLTFWVAVGLGGLTKGPIVLAVLLATMVALAALDWQLAAPPIAWRAQPPAAIVLLWLRQLVVSVLGGVVRAASQWWGRTRPWVGVPILAAIVGPWMWLVHQRAPGFLAQIFHIAQRHATSGMEQHSGPPGFYLVLIFGLFFPWILLLPTTLAIAWRHRMLPMLRYALAAVLGPWVFQEVMKTKLPFYILPTFPALALLTADALVRCLRGQHDDLRRPAFRRIAGVWAVAAVLLSLVPWVGAWPSLRLAPQPWGVLVCLAVLGVAYGGGVYALFRARRFALAGIAMGAGGMLLVGTLLAGYLPRAPFLRLSLRTAEAMRQAGATNLAPGDAQMISYKEASLAYYQGGAIREQADDRFLEKPPAVGGPHWLLVPRSVWDRATPAAKAVWDLVPTGEALRGVDLAGKVDGQRVVELVILRRRPTSGD